MSDRFEKMTLVKRNEAGITFSAVIAVPGGRKTVSLSADQLQEFADDPAQWFAKLHCVTKQDYLDWVESDGLPRCGAVTRLGQRCRNSVSGGGQRGLLDWLNEEAGYCTIHGGEDAVTAKQKRWKN